MNTNRRKRDDLSDPLAYSLKQAARVAGMSRQTLSKHLGEISHRRTAGRVMSTRPALERWLEGHDAEGER